MPHIEELPLSTKTVHAPGWAYVPDTGFDPSKAPLNPTARKRRAANRTDNISSNELSARQAAALQRRLAELDRDHRRDVEIPVPKRDESKRGKVTTNVKRVLGSQKTWVNWLDDEEAMLRQAREMPPPAARRPDGRRDSRRVSTASATPAPAGTSSSRRKSNQTDNFSNADDDTPSMPSSALNFTMRDRRAVNRADHFSNDGDEASSDIIISQMPTEDEIQQLLSAPPLSYNAARCAAPEEGGPPQRQFCEMCGYWGRVRCLKCGGRVCGQQCMEVHQEPGGGCRGVFG